MTRWHGDWTLQGVRSSPQWESERLKISAIPLAASGTRERRLSTSVFDLCASDILLCPVFWSNDALHLSFLYFCHYTLRASTEVQITKYSFFLRTMLSQKKKTCWQQKTFRVEEEGTYCVRGTEIPTWSFFSDLWIINYSVRQRQRIDENMDLNNPEHWMHEANILEIWKLPEVSIAQDSRAEN